MPLSNSVSQEESKAFQYNVKLGDQTIATISVWKNQVATKPEASNIEKLIGNGTLKIEERIEQEDSTLDLNSL